MAEWKDAKNVVIIKKKIVLNVLNVGIVSQNITSKMTMGYVNHAN